MGSYERFLKKFGGGARGASGSASPSPTAERTAPQEASDGSPTPPPASRPSAHLPRPTPAVQDQAHGPRSAPSQAALKQSVAIHATPKKPDDFLTVGDRRYRVSVSRQSERVLLVADEARKTLAAEIVRRSRDGAFLIDWFRDPMRLEGKVYASKEEAYDALRILLAEPPDTPIWIRRPRHPRIGSVSTPTGLMVLHSSEGVAKLEVASDGWVFAEIGADVGARGLEGDVDAKLRVFQDPTAYDGRLFGSVKAAVEAAAKFLEANGMPEPPPLPPRQKAEDIRSKLWRRPY